MNQNAFVSPDAIRARFSLAMSAMYQSEVPLYGELLDLVGRVNREVLAADPDVAETLRANGELQRLAEERHGAIRLGSADELATMARLFAVMGMQPVAYYDLACAGVPVHATAFRAIDEASLAHSPFRVFTSLLRLELIDDPALRAQAAQILAGRQIFTRQALLLIEQCERAGGLSEEQAGLFIREALQTFRWQRQARVSAAVYQQLHEQHRLIADVVAFPNPHINHLTPCTLDIDAVQAAMPARGMAAKELVEGPPARRCPILLRQTSFKALDEAVQFACGTPGSHSARFGEIEQRGAALTARGRALYDRLLAATRERCQDVPAADYQEAYAEALAACFADFPDDYDQLRREDLVFGRYRVTGEGHAAQREGRLAGDREALLKAGQLHWEPQRYEDFLPVSAAGIFQSNLGGNTRAAYDQSANRAEFERALGRPVLDELVLYAQVQNVSLEACARELGLPLV
ncbi:VOC family protein [Pseudomonas sp. GCM10022188]|uniref:2-oxoadipate dioxygenase/decarboxylase HglS n=1 Tax=Pseudomonas TaxID=286 RepID=UPI001E2E44F8|nr:VOC family protein [Pseudomonas oryzagri]MCC6076645.1 VOC family protein [Pseudomonas oryzagri]